MLQALAKAGISLRVVGLLFSLRSRQTIAVVVVARGAHRTYDAFLATLTPTVGASSADPASARRLAQSLATALQASLLLRHAPAFVADAFCATRLASTPYGGASFGVLPGGHDARAIVERALPEAAVTP